MTQKKEQLEKKKLIIGWLYPELMSTYGDRGNIIVLQKRCEWRAIDVEVKRLDSGYSSDTLKECDLLFMGGAQDRQQTIVSQDLKEKKQTLSLMIEDNIPGLYICGAYQFLGNYYKEADGTIIDGLGILDLHTENPGITHPRLIGNVLAEINEEKFSRAITTRHGSTIVGFENHGGRTYLGKSLVPFAKVIVGKGNNGEDETEGAVYKKSIGTYLHGPLLPKNPHIADYLISMALEKKYGKKIELGELDDTMEIKAHEVIAQRIHDRI